MPDGRKVRLLEFATGDAESVRKMLRLLKPYSLRPHVTWQRGLIELVVSVAGMSAGLALAAHGSQRIDEYFDPEPTVQSLGPPLLYTCLGGVMAVLGMVAIIWSFRWLERLIKYSSRSHHGPTVDEFWSVFGKNLGPIQMEDGVKYRYLDPKALASQRKVAWSLFGSLAFMTVLITGCVALLPPETAQPEAQRSAWIVCAVLAIATPLPLLFLKRERAQLALLQDTVWTEGDRLFVQRRDLVQSFSTTPISTKAQKKNQNSHFFLSSFEEFKNEAGTYRLDRRYLWPIDDHMLFDGK
jgi:hypothetical protein